MQHYPRRNLRQAVIRFARQYLCDRIAAEQKNGGQIKNAPRKALKQQVQITFVLTAAEQGAPLNVAPNRLRDRQPFAVFATTGVSLIGTMKKPNRLPRGASLPA